MKREEAIKFANCLKNNYTIDFNDMTDFCDMAIKALEQEPRWISCSERLPEEPEVGKEYRDPSESVLVQLSNGEMKVSRYWSHMNSIHANLNNWIDLYSFEEVVAWQPLPEPYKAESEGV